MADYYPLIARAVAGLDSSATGEQRRALYERARTALVAQLRGVTPALSESDITRERLALEASIRKVEAEAAQRARIDVPQSDSLPKSRPGDALRSRPSDQAASAQAAADRAARPERPQLPGEERGGRMPRPDSVRPDSVRPESARPDFVKPDSVRPESSRRESRFDQRREEPRLDPPAPPGARERPGFPPRRSRNDRPMPGGERPSLSEQGNRGFRDVVAEADELGSAAAQANRSARDTYNAVPSPSAEFDRLEPDMEQRSGGISDDLAYSFDESPEEAERRLADSRGRTPVRSVKEPSRFGIGRIIKLAVVLIVLAGAGALAWTQGPRVMRLVQSLSAPTKTAEVPQDAGAQPATRPKINDRVGQPGSQPVAPVAQRVVLYDEDPNDQQGKQYVGSAVWRTESVPGAAGQPPDMAIRADIDIPERKFKISLVFRRNNDASLPASHTAELTFVMPPDVNGGGINNVPGMLMKTNEQTRGTPLAGLAVKVTDGFFLLGLSNVDADRQRNIQLLKERAWLDIPLVYANQRRAIVAIEKGAPGERVFNEVFSAWKQ